MIIRRTGCCFQSGCIHERWDCAAQRVVVNIKFRDVDQIIKWWNGATEIVRCKNAAQKSEIENQQKRKTKHRSFSLHWNQTTYMYWMLIGNWGIVPVSRLFCKYTSRMLNEEKSGMVPVRLFDDRSLFEQEQVRFVSKTPKWKAHVLEAFECSTEKCDSKTYRVSTVAGIGGIVPVNWFDPNNLKTCEWEATNIMNAMKTKTKTRRFHNSTSDKQNYATATVDGIGGIVPVSRLFCK